MFIITPVDNGYLVTLTERGTGVKKQKIASSRDEVIELFREYDANQIMTKKKTDGTESNYLNKIINGDKDDDE